MHSGARIHTPGLAMRERLAARGWKLAAGDVDLVVVHLRPRKSPTNTRRLVPTWVVGPMRIRRRRTSGQVPVLLHLQS